MKYFIFVALCIVMWLLTACGGSNMEVQPTTDHILTILARNTYEGPIRQAEQALIAEWAQRPDKEGHTFRLELTFFHPDDELNLLTRLDTMLMAGQAYDIFFPVADHRHIRDYAQSGFLTNFYPLIENCPHTDVNDFFTRALEAWEIDGGLYVFPWEFSFNYAFINSTLPPSLIEQFNAHNTITVAELVDIYHKLQLYHAYDFEHFNFSHGSTLHHPVRIVASYLGNFIDFENYTASLTDDIFIAFLTDLITIFDDRHLRGQDNEYWRNNWVFGEEFFLQTPVFNPHSVRMIARGVNAFTWAGAGQQALWTWDALLDVTMSPNVFIVESRDWFPAAAAMPENPFAPYFEAGIPLVDEQGRLLIAENTSYPVGTSISVGANGVIAWDFIRHLVNTFSRREMHSFESLFYPHSIAIPIARDLFDFRVFTSLRNAHEFYSSWWMFPHGGFNSIAEVERWHDERPRAMLPYMAALAEMPMALTHPPIPDFLYVDNLELLLRGLITPQDFAQRTQNAVSLWLIGG